MFRCLLVTSLVLIIAAAQRRIDPARTKERIKIANCRALCLKQFLNVSIPMSDHYCNTNPDCLMCWRSCEMLLTDNNMWGPMCKVDTICFSGCLTACEFQKNGAPTGNTPMDGSDWSMIRIPFNYDVLNDSIHVSWTPPIKLLDEIGPPVYSIMGRSKVEQGWTEIRQTTKPRDTFFLSQLTFPAQVKVIVVTSLGVLDEIILNGSDQIQIAQSLQPTNHSPVSLSGHWSSASRPPIQQFPFYFTLTFNILLLLVRWTW